jgi:hypothetical protein
MVHGTRTPDSPGQDRGVAHVAGDRIEGAKSLDLAHLLLTVDQGTDGLTCRHEHRPPGPLLHLSLQRRRVAQAVQHDDARPILWDHPIHDDR